MKLVKLSILILTHNRPELFKRCINSVLRNITDDIEIIVNNDSNDITEVPGATYFYEKHDDLSDTYKMLFNKAKGEYVYFLEDDDYITKNFFKHLDFSYDIMYMNFIRFDEIIQDYEFIMEEQNDEFQLSQILFKKDLVTEFPKGNLLHNDWFLFQHIKAKTNNIKIIKNKMFVQTIDGNDNISMTKNERFK